MHEIASEIIVERIAQSLIYFKDLVIQNNFAYYFAPTFSISLIY